MFESLFSPIKIGNLEIPNRILSTGHDTTLPTDGTVNEALIAYHEARAKGGVGLIVTQVTGIHETARYTSHILMGTNDKCIPGFAKLADRVHAHGTKLIVQLFHPGREIMESQDGSLPVAYAPSAVPSERFHVIPRALNKTMIDEIIDGYAAAAKRVKEAGADGIEIVASHGYLPSQFLNPHINLRTDDYGGSVENRMRFLDEIITAIRDQTGNDFVIGLRICGDEKDHEGLTETQSLDVIKALEAKIDYVSVIAGTSASVGGAIHIVPPMMIKHAYLAPFAATVKASVAIPVLVAGRINQPQDAEKIIAAGAADMCGMTRALICDPAMPNKAKEQAPDTIRACIGCNQACIGHFHKGYPISCIQHPETGRELIYGRSSITKKPQKILIAGGGPAGLKAASVAAARGHDVTLYEAESQFGGQALLAQLLPGRAEFGGIVTNLQREAENAGAKLITKSPVTSDMVMEATPDQVIIATGGKPRWPITLEHGDGAHIVDAWQVLKNEANLGASVVIADWRSDWIGVGLAEMLAESGCRVRLAVNGLHAGETIPFYVRDHAAARLNKLGVEVIPYARLYGADENTVYCQHTASGEPIIFEDTDTLVLAQGQESETSLFDELSNLDLTCPITAIGDCLMPRTAEEAVLEGLKVGWAV